MAERRKPKAIPPQDHPMVRSSEKRPLCWDCENFDPDKYGMWCMVRGRCNYHDTCGDYQPIS